MKLCKCGCGKLCKKDFVQWHYNRNGRTRSPKYQPYKAKSRQTDGPRWYVRHRNMGKKTQWARIIYQNVYLNGKEIPKGYDIHHKDENPENDDPENLEMLSRANHLVIHKGKRIVLERNEEKREFLSFSQAAVFLGVCHQAISHAFKRKQLLVKGYKITTI